MQKICRKCGLTFEPAEAFFRRKVRSTGLTIVSLTDLHGTCIGCELTARTKRKERNRWREKARRTFHHHADKYIKIGKASNRTDFAERYGWNLDDMAHDIKHAAANGCRYCRQMYSEMAHGLADITLDIHDLRLPPYYDSNTRWICMTCNREKRKTLPELWGAKLRCWEQWRNHQERLNIDPFAGLPLLEGISLQV